jgi:superfamily II DNA or RNA helicase
MQRPPVPGSVVWLRQRRWRVDRAQAEHRIVRLDLSHPSGQLTILTPFDRPRSIAADPRPIHVRRQQGIARLAYLAGSAPCARLAQAVIDGRIDIWPHQIEPVLAVLDGHRRLLIADDVGLGKTIEAGLILAEAVRRQPGARALVITPAGLRQQWVDELDRRFSIAARTADAGLEDALRHTTRGGNPWLQPGVWIASIDYLKQPHVLAGLPADAWDVIVLDEAHMATGQSDRHDACDELGRRARTFVLLSATPHDGDVSRFARLLRLGSLPYAADTLTVFRRTRHDIALPRRRVVRWHRVRATAAVSALLGALQAFERAVLSTAGPARHEAALLLLSVLRKRALSTMAAFTRTLARRIEWLDAAARADRPDWMQPSFDFGDDDMSADDRVWLTADVGLPRARERAWLARLRTLAVAAGDGEPKLRRLRELLERVAEPVVVFTEFRHSLEDVLRTTGRLRDVAVLHGGLPDVARQRQLGRFLSGEASVLLATDVGSQGLNLQSRARWLINLELPWNPARLEQRLGRLDRIGQTRRVHATLLLMRHPAEHTMLASLSRRTHVAQRTLGASALADLTPPPLLVTASEVFTGNAPDSRATDAPVVLTCCHYRRRARAHAVVAVRRRALKVRWRGSWGGRPAHVRLPIGNRHRDATGLLVVGAAIADGTGATIDRRSAIIAVDLDLWRTQPLRTLVEASRPAVERALSRRIRRLSAVVTAASTRRRTAEQAIAVHLHALRHPDEVQPGLFSQRAALVFRETTARAAIDATATTARLRLEEARGILAACDLSLELAIERR